MKIIDLHCDTISVIHERGHRLIRNTGHFDLERAVQAGIVIQFFALFPGPEESSIALYKLEKQMETYHSELETNKNIMHDIKCKADLSCTLNGDTVGSILHLEGAEALGEDMTILHSLYESGLRSIGLTWNKSNLLAGGIGEGLNAAGLTSWGKRVVREMEKLGIILDGAHISEKGFFDLLDVYNKPLTVTHANSRALCPHPRNLTDRQLIALKDNGGIIGVNQVNDFIKADNPAVEDLIDHIVYIAELIGVEHIALGSDFDGAENIIMSGVEEYSAWPELLKRRGFTAEEINMILYENAMRIIKTILS